MPRRSEHLARVAETRRALEQARRAHQLAILEARAAGATLQAIGDELNTTRQGARQWVLRARRSLETEGN